MTDLLSFNKQFNCLNRNVRGILHHKMGISFSEAWHCYWNVMKFNSRVFIWGLGSVLWYFERREEPFCSYYHSRFPFATKMGTAIFTLWIHRFLYEWFCIFNKWSLFETGRLTTQSFFYSVMPSQVVKKRIGVCSSHFILFEYLYAYNQCAHDIKYSHTYQHLETFWLY
jgi:hypothetical protein